MDGLSAERQKAVSVIAIYYHKNFYLSLTSILTHRDILNINKLESICGFHDVIRREAKKGLESIKKMEILEDVEPLEDELDNVAFSRKLTKVCTHSKVVGKVSNKKIIKFTKRHKYFESHPIKLNAEGDKFILDTKKSKEAFLKLLNDYLLRSELTKGEYESVAKNSVE